MPSPTIIWPGGGIRSVLDIINNAANNFVTKSKFIDVGSYSRPRPKPILLLELKTRNKPKQRNVIK